MPKIAGVIESTLSDEAFLARMALRHEARLLSSIGKLRDNITNLLTGLETTPAGRLKGVKVNLKQSQRLHKKIVNEFEKTYNKKVDDLLGDFSEIGSLVDKSYRHLGEAAKFTSIDSVMMNTLKEQTYGRYVQFGEQARDRIARSMYDSVVGQSKNSTLMKTIRGILTGHKDVRGRPMTTYAKGFAHDAVLNFHNQVNVKKGEDLGMSHFLYYGNLIDTSRSFCITRAGKAYSKSQIMSWDDMGWKGKSGPALQERGGYNCRHSWRPVRPEWLKDEEGLPVPREEIVGYMNKDLHPVAGGIVQKLDYQQLQLTAAQEKMSGFKAEQKIFKAKKAAGKASAAEVKAYSGLRKNIIQQEKVLRAYKAEIKELRDSLGKEGKKIIKKAKKSAKVVKTPKVKKVKKPKISKLVSSSTTTTLIETDSVRLIKYPGVSSKFLNESMDRLEKLPPHLRQIVADEHFDLVVGDHVTQVMPKLEGVTPRGWVNGTWDEAEGLCDPMRRKIVVTERKRDFGGYWVKPTKERADDVFWHEFGHGLDHSVSGDEIRSSQKKFIKAYKKDLKALDDSNFMHMDLDYFLQEGRSGRQETFAQMFTNLMGAVDETDIRRHFPNVKELMEEELGLVVKKAKKAKAAASGIKYLDNLDGEVWGESKFKKWYKGLSEKEIDALASYKSSTFDQGVGKEIFEDINDYLRKGEKISSGNKKLIPLIDKALSKGVIPDDIIVYRGTSKRMIELLEKKVGKVVRDKSFMSTTLYKGTADDFAGLHNGVTLKIKVPKGTRGAYLGFEDIDYQALSEGEVLLQRGAKMRVLGKRYKVTTKYGYETYLDVEIVPSKVGSKVAKVIKTPEVVKVAKKKKSFTPTPSASWTKKVKSHHKKTDKIWASYRNMSVEEYTIAADKAVKELVDKADVYIRVNPKNLKSILEDGRFKSQFETNTSKGHLNHFFRKGHEKKIFGYETKMAPELRPIYGYLNEGTNGIQKGGLGQYGRIRIKFKDSVRSRTTFTIGDSIDDIGGNQAHAVFQPESLRNPSRLADYPSYNISLDKKDYNYIGKSWQKDPLDYVSVNKKEGFEYWEAQIHRGVSTDDIEHIYFTKAPDTATKELLRQSKIKWSVDKGKKISLKPVPKAVMSKSKAEEWVGDFITTSRLSDLPEEEVLNYLKTSVKGELKVYRGIGAIKQRFTVENWEKLDDLKVGDTVPTWLTRQSGVSSYTKKKSLAKKYAEGTIEIVVEADVPEGAIIADLEALGKALKKEGSSLDIEDLKYMIADKEVIIQEPIKARIISIRKAGRQLPPAPPARPMTAIGDMAECLIGGKPSACSDYVKSGNTWLLKGKEVSTKVAKKLDDMNIPSVWSEVVVSTAPNRRIQVVGRNVKGKLVYRYSAEHNADSKIKNFNNIKLFNKDMPTIRKSIWQGMNEGDPRAFLLEIENRTAIRIGTAADLDAKVKAYGLTTLQNEHIVINGNNIKFNFVAKKGIPASYELTDRRLADWLRERKKATMPGEMLFPDIPAKKLNDFLKKISGKNYTVKNFRTYHGTRIAYDELVKFAGVAMTPEKKKKLIKKVIKKVASFLHNTPVVADDSYIDPMVWEIIGGR